MERLTFEGNFCDIASCTYIPCRRDKDCCSQKRVWERLKEYEDIGFTPDALRQTVENARDIEEMWAHAPMLEAYKAYVEGRLVILEEKDDGHIY